MAQGNQSVRSARFFVACPQCGEAVPTTVGEDRSLLPCPSKHTSLTISSVRRLKPRQAIDCLRFLFTQC